MTVSDLSATSIDAAHLAEQAERDVISPVRTAWAIERGTRMVRDDCEWSDVPAFDRRRILDLRRVLR
jgi:hypothetical protein